MSQELVDVINNIDPKRPAKLIFSHSYGGGAEFFLQEHLLDNDLTVLVRGIGSSFIDNVEIINNKNIIAKYTFTDIVVLLDKLRLVNIARVDINHVIDLSSLGNS
ncbi:MAG TPA: hypothetical protein VKR58_12140, partial [Aquella sp.]|nr:hypothetical protein [Aquella sp.]